MSLFENPSAGKFGPPPENAQREREVERLRTVRSTRKGLVLVALGVAYLGLKIGARNESGWTEAIAVLLGVVLLVAQHFIGRQIRDEEGGPEPYSAPTRITR